MKLPFIHPPLVDLAAFHTYDSSPRSGIEPRSSKRARQQRRGKGGEASNRWYAVASSQFSNRAKGIACSETATSAIYDGTFQAACKLARADAINRISQPCRKYAKTTCESER